MCNCLIIMISKCYFCINCLKIDAIYTIIVIIRSRVYLYKMCSEGVLNYCESLIFLGEEEWNVIIDIRAL